MSPGHLERRPATPMYRQIADFYAEKIRVGDIAPGDRLPSMVQLCGMWQISYGTAVNVIATLKADGLVESSSRRGTFAKPVIK